MSLGWREAPPRLRSGGRLQVRRRPRRTVGGGLAGPPTAVRAIRAACPDPTVLLSCAGTVDGVQLMLGDPAASTVGGIALAVVTDQLGMGEPAKAGAVASSLASLVSRSLSLDHRSGGVR